jgi:hypothetical protein
VEPIEERVLQAGDVVILISAPARYPCPTGLDGAPAYEFVLFGANTMVLTRLYFDRAHNAAWEVLLGAC